MPFRTRQWPQHPHLTETGAKKPPAFQNRITCNGILLYLRRQTASLVSYGSVEAKPAQSQVLGWVILERCWVYNFFLIFSHSSHMFSSTSSSCTFVPPSVLSKCVLEKCLLACYKTCFDKYQLQVNDTLNEHRRFFLPFSLNEGDNAWNEEKLRIFSLTYASHGSILFP